MVLYLTHCLEEGQRGPFEVFDVLKPQERFQVHPVAKDPAGRCICQDKDYVDVYLEKYGSASCRSSATP